MAQFLLQGLARFLGDESSPSFEAGYVRDRHNRGDRGQLELHGLNPAVSVLISRTLDAAGAVAAAEDALARRQDSLRACRQALRIGLSSMLRQQ